MKQFGLRRGIKTDFSPGHACGKYVLEHILGEGGMGVVWQASDPANSQYVAIKVVAEGLLTDPGIGARFQNEVRRHALLNHPNIVRLLDTFSINDQQCMVMSLIGGESLATLMQRTPNHALPVEFAIRIFTDVLSALDYAHRNGILHRDVKPSNILLDSKHRAYLADFGIAIAVGEARLTRAGVAVGTAEYMSPEQIRTPEHIDHRTDVYSGGCVLYEMLTGRPPFIYSELGGPTADMALRAAHVKETPVPPRERVPSIPPGVSDVIMSALSKDPDQRPQGCAEFSRLIVAAASPRTQAPEKNSSTLLTSRSLAIFGLLAGAVGAILYIAAT
jgi:serine/threonine-protein kinase